MNNGGTLFFFYIFGVSTEICVEKWKYWCYPVQRMQFIQIELAEWRMILLSIPMKRLLYVYFLSALAASLVFNVVVCVCSVHTQFQRVSNSREI